MNFNATLIGQSIAFVVYVWFVMKYVWPYFMKMMNERRQKIADGLAAAEKGERELELAEKRSTELLHDGKQAAAEVLNQAQQRADEIIEEAKDQARAEGERIKAAAHSEAQQEVQRAREQLKDQVAALALAGAQQILMQEIDVTKHKAALERLAAQL